MRPSGLAEAVVTDSPFSQAQGSWDGLLVVGNRKGCTLSLADHAHVKTEYLHLVGIGLGDRVGKVEGERRGTEHWQGDS